MGVGVLEALVMSANMARRTFNRGVSRARIAVFKSSLSRDSSGADDGSEAVEYMTHNRVCRRDGLDI